MRIHTMTYTYTELDAKDQCNKHVQQHNPRNPPLQDFQIYKAPCVCMVQEAGSLKPLQMWASSPSTQLRLCLFVRDSCANRVHLQHGNKRMNVSCCSQEHFRAVVGDHYICYTGFLWACIFSPKPSVINTWIAPILLFCSLSLHLYIIILIVYSVFGLF